MLIKLFLADSANMWHILILQRRIPAGRIVIALVQARNVVANLLLSSAARLQSPQSLLRAILCKCTFAAATIAASGPPSASTRILRFTPFFALSVGFGPIQSPQNALVHSGIGRLPFEIYTAKFGTVGNESHPNFVEQTRAAPSLKSAMNGTVVGKIFGQPVPLTAASHAKNYRIHRRSLVDSTASCVFGRVEFPDNWFYVVPQFFQHSAKLSATALFYVFFASVYPFNKHTQILSAKLCILR